MNRNGQLHILDLFCGAGGAAMGYHRAGFHVTGVDIRPIKRYPFDFIRANALDYVRDHGTEYDIIHASPPCQRYSRITPIQHWELHPDLISTVRDALEATGKPYIIENVPGARKLLRNPIMLCGSMFGLRLWRHRYFEIYPPIFVLLPPCNHSYPPVLITGSSRRKLYGGRPKDFSVAECRDASKIWWMTRDELDQAIPPVYTEFIGREILSKHFNLIYDQQHRSDFRNKD